MDARKVKERKVEYVMVLRNVLRELGSINRSAENLEAVSEIESALNDTLIGEPSQAELQIGGKAVAA